MERIGPVSFDHLTRLGADLVVLLGAIGAGVGAALAYLKNKDRNW